MLPSAGALWLAVLTFLQDPAPVTRAELLRGSITPERAWWDVLHYRLQVDVYPETRSLKGSNTITFRTLEAGRRMQVDLQPPLALTGIRHGDRDLAWEREGNVSWVIFDPPLAAGIESQVILRYEGTPAPSLCPPWSGGFTWAQDGKGRPFIATTCQCIGASIWWPNKDHGYDEPDRGMDIEVGVPEDLVAVSNGRLISKRHDAEARRRTFAWKVVHPINNYCANLNIGRYVEIRETYAGEAGPLDLSYWVLDDQREKAADHFKEVPRMLQAFEHWFGPYPFYEDGYKLVVVPYSGMEHQSSVTYGNGFANGYGGKDLSGTGIGLKFDFIIVHESGHEWFGNSISAKDAADLWIHESFTNYSENLFVEHHFGKAEGHAYVVGCRRLVRNDRPIVEIYGANRQGSGDMYYKGGNMLHFLRQIVGDDDRWRRMLRGMNETFRRKTVTGAEVEAYLGRESGRDLRPFFEQYLRTSRIPEFACTVEGREIRYRYENVVPGFAYPVDLIVDGRRLRLQPSSGFQAFRADAPVADVSLDPNAYVLLKRR
jgi:aminopeptidase N